MRSGTANNGDDAAMNEKNTGVTSFPRRRRHHHRGRPYSTHGKLPKLHFILCSHLSSSFAPSNHRF